MEPMIDLDNKTMPTVHRTSCHPSAWHFHFFAVGPVHRLLNLWNSIDVYTQTLTARESVDGYTTYKCGNYMYKYPQTWDCWKSRRVRRCLCTKFNGILNLSGTGAFYLHDTIQFDFRHCSTHMQSGIEFANGFQIREMSKNICAMDVTKPYRSHLWYE